MRFLKSILMMTAFGLVAAPASAVDGVRTVIIYQDHVTLEIPSAWNEITEESLEFYSLRSAEASGGRIAEVYQYGFRPGNPEMDFALPQILIQIRESGRLPYGQFLHLPSLDELQRAGSRHLADRAGPLLRGFELENAAYDRDRHALHLANTLDLTIEGRVSVTTVSFLTERGLFTLHCYSHATQKTVMAPIFDRVIDSVRFDDDLRYQPQCVDRWPPRPSTVAYGAATLIAITLVLHQIRRRRRRS